MVQNGECLQSCKMSILLHGAKPSNQILPQEKRVIATVLVLKWNKTDKRDDFEKQMLSTLSNLAGL